MAAAVLSGLMLTGAFPNLDLSWLAWFALVPFFYAISNASPGFGFRMGFITGLVHYLTLMYWVAHTMTSYGGLSWILAIPILFLLTAYLSLFPAALAWIITASRPTPLISMVLIPSVWAGLEYIRSFFLSGFPWELLGYTQYRFLSLIQMVDITGPYGVSFLIAAANTVGALAVIGVMRKRWFDHPVPVRVILSATIMLAIVTSAAVMYGDRRIQLIDVVIKNAPHRTIAAIQGNIPQDVKWDPQFQQATTEKYIELSKRVQTAQADLIVWPESATPFYLYNHPILTRKVTDGIKATDTDFLIGSPSFNGRDKAALYYNSAYLIDKSGQPLAKYDKAHLVPFGEYVPFKQYLPFLGKIVAQVGDFDAGPVGNTLKWDGQQLGVLICYELIFPELGRTQVKNGATLLINLTNDAWYGRTSAPYQHFSTAVFRAVETKRSLIRAANTGISGFIDPVGRIQQTTGLFETAAIHQPVPLMEVKTIYTQKGDIFAQVCLALSVLLTLYSFMLKKRNRLHSGTTHK